MLALPASSLDLASAAASSQSAPHARIAKATRDFEALLLNLLLQSMVKTFSAVPGGETTAAGSDDYQYMGTQALASALSASGGIGIARLIEHKLAGTEVPLASGTEVVQ